MRVKRRPSADLEGGGWRDGAVAGKSDRGATSVGHARTNDEKKSSVGRRKKQRMNVSWTGQEVQGDW